MVGHGLSPSWKTSGKGQVNENVHTCDTWINSPAVNYYNHVSPYNGTAGVDTNPFHFAFVQRGIKDLSDDETRQPGFIQWAAPSKFMRGVFMLNGNSVQKACEIWLGIDGPTIHDLTAVPTKLAKLYQIPASFIEDPDLGTIENPIYPYNGQFFYDGPPIEMFTGHSYGFICEFNDWDGNGLPTIPTSSDFLFSHSTVMYFGGGGDDQ